MESEARKEKNKGIMFILMAAFFFSLMTVFVRLSGDLPTPQKALFRNFVAAILAWGILIKNKEKIIIHKKDWVDLLVRSSCGLIGILCNFYAIDRLNISDANMLNKLSPFFAILVSIFLLKEKASATDWLAVTMAFLGALLVMKPGFSMDAFPAFMGFIGGMCAGIAYAFVRRLGKRGVRGPIIVMFFSTFSTLTLLPLFVISYQPMSLRQLLMLIGAGCAAAGGQLSITAAYTHAPAKEISIYDYSQIIFAALWGFLMFNQVPDYVSIIGYLVIIGAALIRFMANDTPKEA